MDDRLIGYLREQVEFLRASAASYDAGFEGEARRLALTVRVLVHDTRVHHTLKTTGACTRSALPSVLAMHNPP
jgi:hypothetical protein